MKFIIFITNTLLLCVNLQDKNVNNVFLLNASNGFPFKLWKVVFLVTLTLTRAQKNSRKSLIKASISPTIKEIVIAQFEKMKISSTVNFKKAFELKKGNDDKCIICFQFWNTLPIRVLLFSLYLAFFF
jgi:hypothetical protein